jgi:hypothetical protein
MQKDRPILSILIPSIPDRQLQLFQVIRDLQKQIDNRPDEYTAMGEIEILSLMDNKQMSIGEKRSTLFGLAKGKYVCMTDDDDFYTPIFIEKVLQAINHTWADVITFHQLAQDTNSYTLVDFRLKNINHEFKGCGVTQRPAWHCCVWKREIVEAIAFGNTNWGEDNDFQLVANEKAQTECHIPEVLHVYIHNPKTTAAFA